MKFHFLYPADPLDQRVIDSQFAPQAKALGDSYSLISMVNEWDISGDIPEGAKVIYRGWMMTPQQYTILAYKVGIRGGMLLTSPEQYVNCHYLPNWYKQIQKFEFTPATVVLPDNGVTLTEYLELLRTMGWQRFFVKDYVKSLKTSCGSILNEPEDIGKTVEEMRKYRGTIEGGICIRRFEAMHDEMRYFVFKGVPYSDEYRDGDCEVVDKVISVIDSPFYSIDVAYNDSGETRVVELGDGQVSDLVGGWTPERLARIFNERG